MVLVFAAEFSGAVEAVGGCGESEVGDLADLHAMVEGDGQLGYVAELKGEVALPAWVDVASGGVDEEADAPEGAFAFETCD